MDSLLQQLPKLDKERWYNSRISRHIRGGYTTRRKYMKQNCHHDVVFDGTVCFQYIGGRETVAPAKSHMLKIFSGSCNHFSDKIAYAPSIVGVLELKLRRSCICKNRCQKSSIMIDISFKDLAYLS
jgi:hypothetical protein